MSEDPVTTLAWLCASGRWRLSADVLPGRSDDVMEDLARAGYSEPGEGRGSPQEFLRLGPSPAEDCPAARLRLFVGALGERPQCAVWVDGLAGLGRYVYAASLPDGLDLMARRAPIVSAAPSGN